MFNTKRFVAAWMVALVLLGLSWATTTIQAVASTSSPTLAPTKCMPSNTRNKRVCDRLIKKCGKEDRAMKWTGKGCRDPKTNRPLGDGGCQCEGYCGYKCKQPCNHDRSCFWNAEAQACFSKATNSSGYPISPCETPIPIIENCSDCPTLLNQRDCAANSQAYCFWSAQDSQCYCD